MGDAKQTILIIGDWFIDENWLVAKFSKSLVILFVTWST